MKTSLAERFHSKYSPEPNTGCWLWMATDNYRYGLISSEGKQLKAHRVSYELHHGPIPPGKVVMHTCDNTLCVNPAHLQLGTQLDNIRDRDRKGRQVPNHPVGSMNGMAKLTEIHARIIKSLLAGGASRADLSVFFGVSRSSIGLIETGKRWNHF